MDRARRAGITALVGILVLAAGLAETAGPPRAPAERVPTELVAAVEWPVTTGLAIAEIVTGGTSASDEWVELTNAGTVPLDLAGLELAYVTSSGATVTRKASWPETLVLDPGRHFLLANASGVHAAIADATYSGGLAATGGALVLRPIGGTPVDTVGWGDAVNGFVEGTAASAPPAGSSLERRPGGALGNVTDTNDNLSDFTLNPLPIAQDLDSPPTPGGVGSPSPSPSSSATPPPSSDPSVEPSAEPSPSPSPSADPSIEPSPSPQTSLPPSPGPSPSPAQSPSPEPSTEPSPVASPSPSPSPSPVSTPSPSPEPTVAPSPSPGPVVRAIDVVRTLPTGATATIEGVLTTALGIIDGGRGGFIQDATGGMALYLDAAATVPLVGGTSVRATGEVAERYGQRTLRVAWLDVTALGSGELPVPLDRPTGSAGEQDEGRRIAVTGAIVESPTSLADGLGLSVDDGTGPVRVIVGPDALGGLSPMRGDRVSVAGPLGQRDSSGTGFEGYRVFATLSGELAILVDPSPSPSASASPAPSSSASPAPSSSASPSPTPQPSDQPAVTIAVARTLPLGTSVRIEGTVTAEPGRLGKPPLLAMEDATAGIVVHLPDGVAAPMRGDRIAVGGKLAAPYGQLEIRPEAESIRRLGSFDLPDPLPVDAGDLGEGLEARLVELEATVVTSPRRATSGDLTIDVEGASGVATRVMVDATADIARDAFVTGARYTFVGIEGQRATRLGASDGYRIWLRDSDDLRRHPSPSPSTEPSASAGTSPSPSSSPTASPGPAVLSIAGALATVDVVVGIEAIVTAGPTLLDATGRRIVVQDPTGAVEVLLPEPRTLLVGDRVRATGTVGTAYGAPRFRATALSVVGHGDAPAPVDLLRAPDAALEWRLARARGLVVDVRRMGDRWQAELEVAGARLLVSGLAGSGIDAGRLPEGATAAVVGIVRRPYPTATDRRFALVPRSAADIGTTAAGSSGGTGGAAVGGSSGGSGTAGSGASGTTDPGTRTDDGSDGPPTIDLGQLGEFRGRLVRVGGLVVETVPDGVLLDDGTARAWLMLAPAALAILPDIAAGDAIAATGTVTGEAGAERVLVHDPAMVVLAAGIAGASQPAASAASDSASSLDPEASSTSAGDAGTTPALGPPAILGLAAIIGLALVALALRSRRWLDRRRTAGRVASRLAGLAGPAPGTGGSPSAAPAVVTVAEAGVTLPAARSGPS